MDLRFTHAQDAFRHEARTWLEANIPSRPGGEGALASFDTKEGFEAHRRWEGRLAEARWSVVSWPEEFGGRSADLFEWLIFEEEYYRCGAPGRVNQNGIGLLAPALFEFGTDEQKQRYLPKIASSEEIWCQGWSEPDSGSDLASIRSRAERRGYPSTDAWVLNGQKTWASRGAFADWIFCLFRSDAGSERHRGLTYFLVPMDAPGVTVRPIAQLDGETGFAEVFFEDVRVGDDQVLGEVGGGWQVAMSTTSSERGLTLRSPARFSVAADHLLDLYLEYLERSVDDDDEDAGGDGNVDRLRVTRSGERVAQALMDADAYNLHTYWTASRLMQGGSLGPEASMNKVFWSELDLSIHEAALELLGENAQLLDADGRPQKWMDGFLFALAGPIYAGTNEIQRNVIAERVLGLPRS